MKLIPPPDANPVKPAYTLPPGACDAHCHIFGPADRYPYAPGRSYTPHDVPLEALRRLHSHLGIERAVIVHPNCHGTDMRVTLDAIAASAGAYRGVAPADPDITDAGLERLDAGGIRGMRFNFVAHLGGTDLALFDRMLGPIAELRWHVVLHLDAQDILVHAERIRRIRVPFVIDHMARVRADAGLEQKPFRMLLELMKNELAWVKVCGAERVSTQGRPFHDAIPFVRALIDAAPERILWGTDFPHPNVKVMPNDGELVDLFAGCCTDERLRKMILVDNASRLYWADSGSA